ncbi:MAG: hypothetical protein ACFB0B_13960 [Thermonemataceae bacterium]
MLVRFLLLFIVSSSGALVCHGQGFEVFSVRYFWLPEAEVRQADDEIYEGLERQPLQAVEAILRAPIKVGKKGVVLVPNFSYAKYFQNLDRWPTLGDAPKDAELFGWGLGALVPVSKRLELVGSVGIDQGTNQEAQWSVDNNLYKGGVGFLLDMKEDYRPYKMGITLFYTEVLGFPIAVLVYRRDISQKWSIDLALPRYGIIDYRFSKNTSLRLEERFTAGRFVFNNAEDPLSSYNIAKVTMTAGILQRIKGPVYAQAAGGFTVWNRTVLFDDRNERLDVLRYTVPQLAFNVSLLMKVDAKNK